MINKFLHRQAPRPVIADSSQRQGAYAEQKAVEWLGQQGLGIVKRNFRCRLGEIDIIAHDGEHLIFVEVRLRKNRRYGGAAATVDARKQRKLILAAQYYLNTQLCGRKLPPCRFDVIALTPHNTGLTINWYKAAFEQEDSNNNAY